MANLLIAETEAVVGEDFPEVTITRECEYVCANLSPECAIVQGDGAGFWSVSFGDHLYI
jgi:hypothetical protein